CARRNESVMRYIEEAHPAAVVLAARWGFRSKGADPFDLVDDDSGATQGDVRGFEEAFANSLTVTVDRLVAAHVAIYFVSDIGEAPFDVADHMAKARVLGVPVEVSTPRAQYVREMAVVTRVTSALQSRGVLRIINPQDLLCDVQHCYLARRG